MNSLSSQLTRAGLLISLTLWLFVGGCSLYQSPDREYLEQQGARFLNTSSGFALQTLEGCSSASLHKLDEQFNSLEKWSDFSQRSLVGNRELSSWVLIESNRVWVLAGELNSRMACLTNFDLDSKTDLDLAIEDFLFASAQVLVGL